MNCSLDIWNAIMRVNVAYQSQSTKTIR